MIQEIIQIFKVYFHNNIPMGCGSSMNQVTDYHHMVGSSKPLRLDEMFHNSNSLHTLNKIYLFGQTQTKRKILELSLDDKSQTLTLKKLSQRYHIPRPKIQRDTIQMMYEEAQQVLPLNMYNSTTLPPFNLMFVTLLSQKVLFLCGGIDFEFWNVCAESFLYKIASASSIEQDKLIKVKLEKPQTNIISQKTTNVKENSSRKSFNKFQRLAFMNQARYSHMGLSIKHPISGKNVVYVFGGFNSNKETLKSCEVYSFQKNTWEKIPDMQMPRATGFCFQYLQKIYVCGGFTSQGKRSKKIQVWDLQTQKWTILNIKLHQGIQQGIITSFSPNQIAIIGGNIEGGSTHSVIRFNMIEETYKWDSDLIHSDSLQKAFNHEGKLYLFGGKKPGFCQVYDSIEKSWTQKKVISPQEMKSGQLTMFSASSKSLIVDFVSISNRKRDCAFDAQDLLVFGTDFYPIIYLYKGKDLLVTSNSVSMKLRLRRQMGILRFAEDEYFMCGGVDTFEINQTKATFKYKVSSKQVEEMDKMPLKKYKFGMVKHKNHIYSIGGSVMNEKREQVEVRDCCRFNLLTKKWQKLPNLNFHRSQCQVVELQNGLLVFGGYADGQWIDKLEFLNTQQDKILQFYILLEKLPPLFPIYSKLISTKKNAKSNQSTLRLFVLNRNLHLNNFQEIYFNINPNKICKNDSNFYRIKSDYDVSLNKLQQFDSIDVIITERQKTLDKDDTSRVKLTKDQIHIKEEDQAHSDSQAVDISGSPFIHKKQSRVPQSKKVIKDSTEKIFKQDPIIPSVQTILIKSKNQQNEFDQISKNQQNSKKDSNKRSNQNINRQITQYSEQIEQMSLQFQNISLNNNRSLNNSKSLNNVIEPLKIGSTNYTTQKYQGYENIKSQPMEEYSMGQGENDKGVSLPVQAQVSEKWGSKSCVEPHFIEGTHKKVVKGLDCVENINDWIRVKQTTVSSRVVFVRNDDVVKCNISTHKSGDQVKINVVKEQYQNGELLFDKTNGGNSQSSKLHTVKLRQIYN